MTAIELDADFDNETLEQESNLDTVLFQYLISCGGISALAIRTLLAVYKSEDGVLSVADMCKIAKASRFGVDRAANLLHSRGLIRYSRGKMRPSCYFRNLQNSLK